MIKNEERIIPDNFEKSLEVIVRKYYKALEQSKQILEKLLNDTIQYDIALAIQEWTLNDMVNHSTQDVRKFVNNVFRNYSNLEINQIWQKIYEIPSVKTLKDQVGDMYLQLIDKYDMYLSKKVPTKDGFEVLENLDLRYVTKEDFNSYVQYLSEKKSDFDITIDELRVLKAMVKQSLEAAFSAVDKSAALREYYKAIANIKLSYKKVKQLKSNVNKKTKVLSEKVKPQISEQVIQNATIELANIASASLKASGKRMTKNQLNHYIIDNKQFQYLQEAKNYLDGIMKNRNFNKEERAEFLKAINWKDTRKKLISSQRKIDRKFKLLDKQFMHNGKVVTLRSIYTLNLNFNEVKDLIKKAQKMPAVKSSKKKSLLANFENKKDNTLTKEQQELLCGLDKLIGQAKKVSQGKITLRQAKIYIYSKDFQFADRASRMVQQFIELNKYTEEQVNQFQKLINWKKYNRKLENLQKAIHKKFRICNKEFLRSNQIVTLKDYDLLNMSEKRFDRLCKLIAKERNNIRKYIEKENEKALFNVYLKGKKMLKSSKNKVSQREVISLNNELHKIKIPDMLIEPSINDFKKKIDSFIKDKRRKSHKMLLKQTEDLINKITASDITLVSRGYKRRTRRFAVSALGMITTACISLGISSFNSQARNSEKETEKVSYERTVDDSILLASKNIEMVRNSVENAMRIETKHQRVYSTQARIELITKKNELEAAKWVCNYYGVSIGELNKFTDTFIETHKILGTNITNKMAVYNYLYTLSCIPNEEKLRAIREAQNITQAELDIVLSVNTGEAWRCYFDGYATGSTNYLRTISKIWTSNFGPNNIYTQIIRPRQYSVYLENNYLGCMEEIKNGSMRTQGVIDALYSQLPVHLFTSFEWSKSGKYDFQYTPKGNCYGNPKTDFDISIIQDSAAVFTEDYGPKRSKTNY